MFTGKQFELKKDFPAIEIGADGGWFTLPAGATIEVISGPDGVGDHDLITVVLEKRLFAIFAIELITYGTEIKDRSAAA